MSSVGPGIGCQFYTADGGRRVDLRLPLRDDFAYRQRNATTLTATKPVEEPGQRSSVLGAKISSSFMTRGVKPCSCE